MYKFNIGSAINGEDKKVSEFNVLSALRGVGFIQAEIIKTERSDTETTYVVVAKGFNDWFGKGHINAVFTVCELLCQDAIAYKALYQNAEVGFLVGPKAEDWGGEFKQEYFIE